MQLVEQNSRKYIDRKRPAVYVRELRSALTRMQGLIWIGLVFSAVAPIWFFAAKVHYWKRQVVVLSSMSADDPRLTSFVLHRSAYNQIRVNEREIRVHGMMYDIFSKEVNGDTLKIQALIDVAESGWMAVQLNLGHYTRQPAASCFFMFYFFQGDSVPLPVRPDHGKSLPKTLRASMHTRAIEVQVPPPEANRLIFFPHARLIVKGAYPNFAGLVYFG